MKKLLYLLLLGVMVVACDKQDDGALISSAAPVLATKAAPSSKVLDNNDILEIVSNVLSLDIKKGSEKGLNSSASKGADRITMHLFLADTVIYSTYIDESNDDLCIEEDDATFLSSVHLNNQNGQIEVTLGEDDEILSSVQGNFDVLFGLPLNVLLKLNGSNVVGQAIFDDANSATFN